MINVVNGYNSIILSGNKIYFITVQDKIDDKKIEKIILKIAENFWGRNSDKEIDLLIPKP